MSSTVTFDPQAPENQMPADVSRRCGYCGFVCKEMAPLREHLDTVHPGSPVRYGFVQSPSAVSVADVQEEG